MQNAKKKTGSNINLSVKQQEKSEKNIKKEKRKTKKKRRTEKLRTKLKMMHLHI